MKRDHEVRVLKLSKGTMVVPRMELQTEPLHSTLLPVTHLPEAVFVAATEFRENQANEVNKRIVYPENRRELTPFLLREGSLFTFHDLREPDNPFRDVTDFGSAEILRSTDLWMESEGRRRFVTLLNRSLYRYTSLLGIRYDPNHRRFYFPALTIGKPESVSYRSLGGRRSTRQVAWEPQRRSTGEGKGFWYHLASRLLFHQFGDSQWCMSIRPERHLTEDGMKPLPFNRIGPRVTRLKARMYNDLYLNEVNFWRDFLSNGQPRFILNFGHQSALVDARLIKFNVAWPGIVGDEKEFMNQGGQEDLFSLADWNEALGGEPIDWDDLAEDDLEDEDAG